LGHFTLVLSPSLYFLVDNMEMKSILKKTTMTKKFEFLMFDFGIIIFHRDLVLGARVLLIQSRSALPELWPLYVSSHYRAVSSQSRVDPVGYPVGYPVSYPVAYPVG